MTINLYPDIVHEQDLAPTVAFGSEIDEYCEQIHDGCKGWGADQSAVIAAIAHDATTRIKISIRYKELYQQEDKDKKGDLSALMKKEFGSSDFGLTLTWLTLPSDQAEAAMLHKAMAGIGADVTLLYSILCGRTNSEMILLKKAYFVRYHADLTNAVARNVRGDNEKLLLNALQACEQEYDAHYHTKEKALEDAECLYQASQGKWFGTDERSIFKIICAAPPPYLELINTTYANKYGYTLNKAMEKELGGKAKEGLLFTLGMKLQPYETMAGLVKKACAGFGTNEILLASSIVRYQHVMKNVMAAHIELYSKSIHDRVRSECGGKFKDLLVAVLNAAWPEHI